jgi:hypothetical protein
MSLNKVQKMVRGVRGRDPPTGETDLKSWSAFEEEISLIWKNARDYNEDGSDLYNLSLEFEVCTSGLDIVTYAHHHRKYSRRSWLLPRPKSRSLRIRSLNLTCLVLRNSSSSSSSGSRPVQTQTPLEPEAPQHQASW